MRACKTKVGTEVKPMEESTDRRIHPRLPMQVSARVRRLGDSGGCEAQTEDINCTGVCFRATEAFALGELIEIYLDLNNCLDPSLRSSSLVCLGKVVQAEAGDPGAPFRYGCAFVDYALQIG